MGLTKADYLARGEAELAKAKAALADYSGGCGDCRWSSFISANCRHPAVRAIALAVPDAYARKRIQECDEQRDSNSIWGPVICGPPGALFEGK